MDSTQLTPEQVASQLAKPDGELGRAVGEWMNRNNLGITKAAYGHLQIDHGTRLLEIGPGNGALVSFIVTNDNAVNYTGIDISQTMVEAARERNAEMVARRRVKFLVAPAERIPFPDGSFDRAVSVNCIYFWDIPKALQEIYRVLVKGGRLVIASNSPETMASNPFITLSTGFKNTHLNKDSLVRFHKDAGYSTMEFEDYSEDAKRMDGSSYVRRSFITVAVK